MKLIGKFFQWSVIAGFIFVIVFVGNSYRYFVYALLCSFALYFPFKKIIVRRLSNLDRAKSRYDVNGKRITMQAGSRTAFVVLLVLVYLLVISVFSVSPSLERKEFALTHPNWLVTTPFIVNFESNMQRGKTEYTYISLEYRYVVNGQSYSRKLDKAEKQYSFLPIISLRRFEEMRVELLERVSKKIEVKEYELFYNPEAPEEHRFFLANDRFYLQGAWLYHIMFVYSVLLLVMVIIVLLFRKAHNSRKKFNSTIYYSSRTD